MLIINEFACCSYLGFVAAVEFQFTNSTRCLETFDSSSVFAPAESTCCGPPTHAAARSAAATISFDSLRSRELRHASHGPLLVATPMRTTPHVSRTSACCDSHARDGAKRGHSASPDILIWYSVFSMRLPQASCIPLPSFLFQFSHSLEQLSYMNLFVAARTRASNQMSKRSSHLSFSNARGAQRRSRNSETKFLSFILDLIPGFNSAAACTAQYGIAFDSFIVIDLFSFNSTVLGYPQRLKEPFDWAYTVPSKVEQYIPQGSDLKAKDCVQKILSDLIKLVFEQRTQILLPRLDELKGLLSRNPEGDEKMSEISVNKSIAYCRLSRPVSSGESSNSCHRAAGSPPKVMTAHEMRVTNAMITTGLEQSSFNWLVKDNNQTATWKRFTQSLYLQNFRDKGLDAGLYIPHPSILLFHKDAVALITAQPGLDNFPCWAEVPVIEDDELTVLAAAKDLQDEDVARAAKDLQRNELQHQFNERMRSLDRLRNRVSQSADDEKDDEKEDKKRTFALHPRMKLPVYHFWRVAKNLHKDVVAVEMQDEDHKFSTVEDDEEVEDVNLFNDGDWRDMLGFSVKWATDEDVEVYLGKRKRVEEEENPDERETERETDDDEEEERPTKRLKSTSRSSTPLTPPPGNQLALS
ncbi:hypothetical protein B0H19DRAFT_1351308 [Mycena capillaripes]|nr:hypothetical protein B0H19DRAFT_1351308 [Mycena capillaripes]